METKKSGDEGANEGPAEPAAVPSGVAEEATDEAGAKDKKKHVGGPTRKGTFGAGAYTSAPRPLFITMPKLLKTLITIATFVGWDLAAVQSPAMALSSFLGAAGMACVLVFGKDWEGGNFSREHWARAFRWRE